MVDAILGSAISPGPIGLAVKASSPYPFLLPLYYVPRRTDLVTAFASSAGRNIMMTRVMPGFTECSKDMELYLKKVLGVYSKSILGNYVHKFVSKIYNSKPLSTYVVYKLNDKIEYDSAKQYYRAKIRGYAIKGQKNQNYSYQHSIRLKPGMLIHEAKTVGRAGFEKKHLVMWLGRIKGLSGAYYFDSLVPKLHKYDEKKNFVQSSIGSYSFWRIVAIYDPWHGRE